MYFDDCNTAEELEKAHKSWARKLHPDVSGCSDDTKFKQMQAEYEMKIKKLIIEHDRKSDAENSVFGANSEELTKLLMLLLQLFKTIDENRYNKLKNVLGTPMVQYLMNFNFISENIKNIVKMI